MIACHHFLIWSIKELMRNRDRETADALKSKEIHTKTYFREYTASLVEIMSSSTDDKFKLDVRQELKLKFGFIPIYFRHSNLFAFSTLSLIKR